MTAPRQVLPGTTYLVTRRCSQRQFLLRPSATTNQVFRFVLALASRRYGIQVHAFCVLSNHFHLVVTDPCARLPAFHQFLDSLVARAINTSHGRRESFWAPGSFSAVALVAPTDVLEKTAYVLANPVAAGLVRRGRLWPGLWSAPEQIGGDPVRTPRPRRFFDPKGYLPEAIDLELSLPPGFGTAGAFREALLAALSDREAQAERTVRRGFLGVAKVLAQRPTRRPASEEEHRRLRPRVAARDRWRRIEALGQLLQFLHSYRRAWAARRAGALDVIFPAGTYHLRVAHGVPCAGYG